MRRTLDKVLREHRGVGPGFHFLRHFLSLAILIFHCYVGLKGEYGEVGAAVDAGAQVVVASRTGASSFLIDALRPGLFALVGTFFALSGFLVTGSAIRNSNAIIFVSNRVLRILPALTIEVTLSALLLGPIVTTYPLWSYFTDNLFIQYFWNMIGHVQFELPGVFLNNPWPKIVNINLWTLPAELWCYMFMLCALISRLVSRRSIMTTSVLFITFLACIISTAMPDYFAVKANNTHFSSWYIVMLFFIGSLFYINAHIIIIDKWICTISIVMYYCSIRFDIFPVLSGFFLTYCMIYVGMQSFKRFDHILKMDLSYGIYLYGFPITQALILAERSYVKGTPVWINLLLLTPAVIIMTAAFACASWLIIEKPALTLRRYVIPKQMIDSSKAA